MTTPSDMEAATARALAAVYADRIHFEINPERARISFGELGTELPTYHAAVAMTPANALLLAELIMKYVKRDPQDEVLSTAGAAPKKRGPKRAAKRDRHGESADLSAKSTKQLLREPDFEIGSCE